MIYSVLIVGLGQIGMGYDLKLSPEKYIYTHARAFDLHEDFKLVAGVDTDNDSRKQFSEVFDCPSYENIKDSLVNNNPDVVVISNPTNEHFNTVCEILSLSTNLPKLILCEKPLSYNLDEAKKIVEMCNDRGVAIFVNYIRRSEPGAIEVKRRIDNGEIETPVKGVVWYSKGFYHNGSHFFNLLEYWLGPVNESKVINNGRLWDKNDPEPDINIDFENGSVVFLSAWEESFSYYAVELLTPNGRLEYGDGGNTITWYKSEKDKLLQGYSSLSKTPEIIYSGMDKYQLYVVDQIVSALNSEKSEMCTGKDALNMLYSMNKVFPINSHLG